MIYSHEKEIDSDKFVDENTYMCKHDASSIDYERLLEYEIKKAFSTRSISNLIDLNVISV